MENDEINRGDNLNTENLPLEDSKREGKSESLSINLPYSKDEVGNPKKWVVPPNLYILAT